MTRKASAIAASDALLYLYRDSRDKAFALLDKLASADYACRSDQFEDMVRLGNLAQRLLTIDEARDALDGVLS